VLIVKKVKVVCFDALLQVLILKGLHRTRIVQNQVLFQLGFKRDSLQEEQG
jgi:hypothetical protein